MHVSNQVLWVQRPIHFNSGVISWFMDSCPTLDGIRYIDHKEYSADSCDLLNQWANEELKKYPNIPLVLVSRTSEYVKGVNEPDQWERSKLAPVSSVKNIFMMR